MACSKDPMEREEYVVFCSPDQDICLDVHCHLVLSPFSQFEPCQTICSTIGVKTTA